MNRYSPDSARLADWLSHYATCIVDDERCGRKLLEIVAHLRAAPAVMANDRSEALEAALRAVDHTLSVHGHVDADTPLHDRLRAALAPEPEK